MLQIDAYIEDDTMRTTQSELTVSVTKDDTTTRSLTTQEDSSTSTQPGTTVFVLGNLTAGTSKTEFTTPVTTQLNSTLSESADVLHRSLVEIAGNSFSLHCSASVKTQFVWGYRRLDGSDYGVIYNGDRVNEDFYLAESMSVSSCSNGICILDVHALEFDDAGVIVCVKKPKEYWSITLLGE